VPLKELLKTAMEIAEALAVPHRARLVKSCVSQETCTANEATGYKLISMETIAALTSVASSSGGANSAPECSSAELEQISAFFPISKFLSPCSLI
jgi:hypothetical protein